MDKADLIHLLAGLGTILGFAVITLIVWIKGNPRRSKDSAPPSR